MSELEFFLGAFHLLRPAWLLPLPLIAWVWWRVRRRAMARALPAAGIAPHLQAALTVGAAGAHRLRAIDGVALALALISLGASGPTWSRVPDPFVAQTAPVVVVLEVSSSMQAADIAPSRLERAKQKIRDLLELRAGARTALVAYAGTAHRVLPMTDDPSVMQPYLEGLTPDVMPSDGADATAAFRIAAGMLVAENSPGGILLVTDGLQTADLPALEADGAPASAFLAVLPADIEDPGLNALTGAPVVRVTPDDADIRRLDRELNSAYRQALLDDESQPWDDRGWLLAWPAALLVLVWFRRGWTMRWGAALLAGMVFIGTGLAPTSEARAEGIADWFFTPDQQGRLAYRQRDFERAAMLFVDPLWQGYALYRDGQYTESAAVLGRLDTAQAAFAQGMAYIKGREYRDGVRAFETALERDPDYPGAAGNLETAREIVEYIERVREQSDTGEDGGIGADEIELDNESGRGAETEIEVGNGDGQLLSAEQWMNTVDTRTGDFLRQRFAIEAARGQ